MNHIGDASITETAMRFFFARILIDHSTALLAAALYIRELAVRVGRFDHWQ